MIRLTNSNNMIKECPLGYSWTTFFFGLFVPLLRGDLKWAAILFVLTLMVGLLTFGLGGFFVPPVFAFFYNKLFIKEMLEKGYVPTDDYSRQYLVDNGYISK